MTIQRTGCAWHAWRITLSLDKSDANQLTCKKSYPSNEDTCTGIEAICILRNYYRISKSK